MSIASEIYDIMKICRKLLLFRSPLQFSQPNFYDIIIFSLDFFVKLLVSSLSGIVSDKVHVFSSCSLFLPATLLFLSASFVAFPSASLYYSLPAFVIYY